MIKSEEYPEQTSDVFVNDAGAVECWLGDDGFAFPPLDAYELGTRLISNAVVAAGGIDAINTELLARDIQPIVEMERR